MESNKQTSDLPTAGIKFRSHQRVYQQQTSRVTRSNKSVAESEASLTPRASTCHLQYNLMQL
jgi:hypothetical protein